MKVAVKLALGFGLVILLMAGLGLYQYQRMGQIETLVTIIMRDDRHLAAQVQDVLEELHMTRLARERATSAALLRAQRVTPGSDVGFDDARRQYDEHAAHMMKLFHDINQLVAEKSQTSVDEYRKDIWRNLLSNIKTGSTIFTNLTRETDQYFALLQAGNYTGAIAMVGELNALRAKADAEFRTAGERAMALTERGQTAVTEAFRQVTQALLIVVVAAALVAALVATLIGRSVSRPLSQFAAFAERIGNGDLSQQTATIGNDEVGVLGRHLNQMVNSLKSVAKQIRSVAQNVNSATAQIRASTSQQSASTAEQLAAVEQTVAIVSEVTRSGAQISKRAQEVVANAKEVSTSANAGLDAVEATNRAMDAIREQAESVAENIVMLSEKTQTIGEIISAVNDIAERSHLLALNAAIEAASVGEQGRSFAVVAAEMKKLADQAKDATTRVRANLGEIQQGINSSVMLTEEAVRRIASGKELTDSTQRAIYQLGSNITESVEAFQQIVAATNQQQLGLEQVNQALTDIRTASSQTATGTRQLEGAATNLNTLGEQLVRSVEGYQI